MVSDSENDLNEKEESDIEEKSVELDNNEITDKKKEKKKKKVYKLSLEDVEDFNAKLKKRGVIYLSRIPPRMGPAKIKQLLSEHGGMVTRVYLVEEDKAARKRRLRQSGGGGGKSGGKRYVEGWVEFESKKIAKAVGMQLNNTPISNHKRNVHYGDLWSMKYLSKFQWSHLTEKVAYERRVREQKLRIEMMQAQRENANYTSLVQAGKTMDHIEKRLQRKRKQQNTDPSNTTKEPPLSTRKKKRSFPQTKLVQESSDKATKRAVLQSLVS